MDDELAGALAAAQQYADKSLAANTLRGYLTSWQQYERFCAARRPAVGPLDATPEVVAAFLALKARGRMSEQGQWLDAPVEYATVAAILTGINKVFRRADRVAPGDSVFVQAVMAGIAADKDKTGPKAKDALTPDQLRQVIDRLSGPSPQQARDHALATLLGVRIGKHELTPARLRRLDWDDVVFGVDQVVLLVHSGTRSARRVRLVVKERRRGVCPVAALRVWAGYGCDGPVFIKVAGSQRTCQRLTRMGVVKIGQRLSLEPGDGRTAPGPSLLALRNIAMLLLGFQAARRRVEIVSWRWSDFTVDKRGLRIKVRRQKNHKNTVKWVVVPYGKNERYCPVRAWARWRDALQDETGLSVSDLAEDPVFVAIDRHGRLPHRGPGGFPMLNGEVVAETLQAAARACGITADLGAHSLRSGFVTAAVLAGVPLHKIQQQTHHSSLDVLLQYHRDLLQWEQNAAEQIGL
ncbi:tyrosine-type recombinase/integrase [Pedococcus sp. KACC 23699]|uniref:Tyrosine-type recombinase/integrase n=1 Tax=Pedococcus sp. KACC 23699 TaxID=3149228 RepID=A0AAU7JYS1_9MICO